MLTSSALPFLIKPCSSLLIFLKLPGFFFQVPGFPCPLELFAFETVQYQIFTQLQGSGLSTQKPFLLGKCHRVHKQKVTRLPPHCIPVWGPHTERSLTMIWISLLQTCRSYSLLTYILFRAHFTPLLVLTRNTIAKPPMEDTKSPVC